MIPFVGHNIYARFVETDRMVRPSEIDLFTGKAEVDEYERMNPPPKPRNIWERIWFAIV